MIKRGMMLKTLLPYFTVGEAFHLSSSQQTQKKTLKRKISSLSSQLSGRTAGHAEKTYYLPYLHPI